VIVNRTPSSGVPVSLPAITTPLAENSIGSTTLPVGDDGAALKLNKYRTQKKDGNKEVWQAIVQTDEYQAGQRVRYKIEHKYGEAVIDRCILCHP